MGIVTKTGDEGQTSLWSGERVWKDDLRVEAYGTVDELSSFLGLARHSCKLPTTIAAIEETQRNLVRVAGELASQGTPFSRPIDPSDEERLNLAIAGLEARLSLKGFVLPGMTPGSAALDTARTVARRAERRVVALAREAPIGEPLRHYLNRLSDYLFMLARCEEDSEGAIRFV